MCAVHGYLYKVFKKFTALLANGDRKKDRSSMTFGAKFGIALTGLWAGVNVNVRLRTSSL